MRKGVNRLTIRIEEVAAFLVEEGEFRETPPELTHYFFDERLIPLESFISLISDYSREGSLNGVMFDFSQRYHRQ